MHDDGPTLGERMNRELALDPGFTLDHPHLIDALEEEIDATVERAKRAQADGTGPQSEP